MNDNRSPNCEVHTRIINLLREEQYYVNQLVSQFKTIMDNMEEMDYLQLKFKLSKNSGSVFDVSHYRTGETGDPAMHIWLKDNVNSKIIKATNPFYETVIIHIICFKHITLIILGCISSFISIWRKRIL